MAIQASRMTAAEFDAFAAAPENADRLLEFVGGEVLDVVSNPLSSKIAARVSTFLGMYLLTRDIGHLTGADGGYMVSGERYIPDVGFIRYERQASLAYTEGYNPNPPDLAVEVVSPSDTERSLRVKIANYLAANTQVWVIYPEAKEVEVYRPGQPVAIVGVTGTLYGRAVLPGFSLVVEAIFA